MNKLALAALAAVASVATPASATTYYFTISNGATGSGTIEVTPFSATAGTVTAITGTINGAAITGLRPVNTYVNDNVLLFGNDVKFSDGGVGFYQGAVRTDLYYNYGIGSYRLFTNTNGVGLATSISFQLTDAAVPEPATWAMMIVGFGAVGAAMRRRAPRRVPAAA